MSPENALFGIDRILEVVRSHRGKSAREIVETLYESVRQFSKNTPQLDDVTAIVIKVKDPGEPSKRETD
jgi:serine phosphatase RsbU (regulator of sigma subunit)